MACKKGSPCSGKVRFNVNSRCKVCELVDDDNSKKQVAYCSLCKQYICEQHWGDWVSRGLASLLNLLN